MLFGHEAKKRPVLREILINPIDHQWIRQERQRRKQKKGATRLLVTPRIVRAN